MIWTFEGHQLEELLRIIGDPDVGNLHTLRIASDEGDLKVKFNEGAWSLSLAQAQPAPSVPSLFSAVDERFADVLVRAAKHTQMEA